VDWWFGNEQNGLRMKKSVSCHVWPALLCVKASVSRTEIAFSLHSAKYLTQGCQTWDLNFNPQERLIVLLFLLVLNPGQPINAVFFEEMWHNKHNLASNTDPITGTGTRLPSALAIIAPQKVREVTSQRCHLSQDGASNGSFQKIRYRNPGTQQKHRLLVED